VTDASGRSLTFQYNETIGRLLSITAPPNGASARVWEFSYDTSNRLCSVADPDFITRTVTDSWGRVTQVIDPNGNGSTVSFDSGSGVLVTDPSPFQSQTQSFDYQNLSANYKRTYTDRRGKAWQFKFDIGPENLVQTVDPLAHINDFTYDSNHNRLTARNALNKTWSFTYDARGNVLTSTNPLGAKATATYDTLNNLISITPPADYAGNGNVAKMVTFEYGHVCNSQTVNPTKLTKIFEPPNTPGGNPVETEVFHYQSACGDNANWTGLLREVIDANGVSTSFQYDTYGQLETEIENGLATTPDASWPTVENSTTSNAAGITYKFIAYGRGQL
jgi:YD repeat-containing protein